MQPFFICSLSFTAASGPPGVAMSLATADDARLPKTKNPPWERRPALESECDRRLRDVALLLCSSTDSKSTTYANLILMLDDWDWEDAIFPADADSGQKCLVSETPPSTKLSPSVAMAEAAVGREKGSVGQQLAGRGNSSVEHPVVGAAGLAAQEKQALIEARRLQALERKRKLQPSPSPGGRSEPDIASCQWL